MSKTVADILAEMRDERIIRLEDADVTRCLLRNLADRIEAAMKQESGNVAALRKALEAIDKNTDLLDIAEDVAPNLHPSHSFVAVQIRKIAHDALSEPARNCDVGTVEEQSQRYDEFCDIHDCKSDCPLFKADSCELAWAQLPYKEVEESDESKEIKTSEEEPMPVADKCPGCGKEPRLIHPSFDGGTFVECSTIGCIGYGNQIETWAETDRKAIGRWNEFVKKVRSQHD